MNKYLEAEKELAELLGWEHVIYHACYGLEGYRQDYVKEKIPQWCKDSTAAFELLVKYEINVQYFKEDPSYEDSTYCVASVLDEFQDVIFDIDEDWATSYKLTAVRFAIVKAVIMKLKRK